MRNPPRVLVISSQVAYGSVGIAATAAGLRMTGVPAMALPTVVLSNHPGLGPPAGRRLPGEEIGAMLDALDRLSELDRISAVATGYFADAAQVDAVAERVERLKARRHDLVVMCDPVLGDDPEGLYVDEAAGDAVKGRLLPLATITTPNRFELAWLTGKPVASRTEAIEAARHLSHREVVATSVPDNNTRVVTLAIDAGQVIEVAREVRSGVPHGTGDLLSGLYLGCRLNGMELPEAIDEAMTRLDQVIARSIGEEVLDLDAPCLNRPDIASTHRIIARYIRRTPVIDINLAGIERPVTLKLENLQVTGSFKARGAYANLLGLTPPPVAVTAASGGNHGIAVAHAAASLGIPARIYIPEITSPAKIARIEAEGAEVVIGGARYSDALAACEAYAGTSGAVAIHAYNSEATMLGQGTIAAELEAQASDLDTVMVAVGGGGLIGGIAAWYAGAHQILGVEPERCNALAAALAAGQPVTVVSEGVAADSLGASRLGDLSFGVLAATGARSVLVSDADIVGAQRWLWDNLRLLTEPGGATALAALLCGAYPAHPRERIGVVICGANVDPGTFTTRS